jgi:hypothetical protein
MTQPLALGECGRVRSEASEEWFQSHSCVRKNSSVIGPQQKKKSRVASRGPSASFLMILKQCMHLYATKYEIFTSL